MVPAFASSHPSHPLRLRSGVEGDEDDEHPADEEDHVVQVSDTVAALVGRKIEELFVFWSRVAA